MAGVKEEYNKTARWSAVPGQWYFLLEAEVISTVSIYCIGDLSKSPIRSSDWGLLSNLGRGEHSPYTWGLQENWTSTDQFGWPARFVIQHNYPLFLLFGARGSHNPLPKVRFGLVCAFSQRHRKWQRGSIILCSSFLELRQQLLRGIYRLRLFFLRNC